MPRGRPMEDNFFCFITVGGGSGVRSTDSLVKIGKWSDGQQFPGVFSTTNGRFKEVNQRLELDLRLEQLKIGKWWDGYLHWITDRDGASEESEEVGRECDSGSELINLHAELS